MGSLARLLISRDNSLIVAVEPDHPLLFSGPDVLVGGNGRVVTFFLPKVRELRNPDLLLARLAVARLALPATMRAALLIGSFEGADRLVNLARRDFDEVVDLADHPSVAQFVLDRKDRRKEDISNLQEIKRGAVDRFEALYTFSYEQFLGEGKGTTKERLMESLPGIRSLVEVPSWTGHAGKSRKLYQAEGATVAFLQLGRRAILEKMRPLCVTALMLDYSLDNGIPYPRARTLNVMFSDRTPVSQFDPLKPIRAAAFAGWAVSVPESGEEAQSQIDELREQFRYS